MSALGPIDYAVLFLYFAASLAVGLWFGRGERTTRDFFLGGKRQHWLLAGISIIATEVSALTVVGVPADAFKGDWNYLQMYAGAFTGRMLIVYMLLPAFYGGDVTTVYEYLGQRFGLATRVTASLMFLASRIIGSGIRLLAASLAVAVVFDWPLVWVVIATAGIAIAYTTFGGIKAILWTDALQAAIFLLGPAALDVFLLYHIPGPWTDNLSAANDAGKFKVFTWDANLNNEKSFWVLFIHATVLNMAALGTDQDLTQRMLTCPDLRRGQRSLIFNACMGLPVVCLFLLLGTVMFAFYHSRSELSLPPDVLDHTDRIVPHFIATILPTNWGLKGLLIAAIFAASMSSLSSALGALSSTVVTDLYRPWVTRSNERHYLFVARLATFLAGVILAGVAIAFSGHNELLWQAFKWVGLIFGGMLGVFLLGVTTKTRGHDVINVLAMLSSTAGLVVLKGVQDSSGQVYIAWPWWVVIGTAWTYLLAVCFRTNMWDRLSSRSNQSHQPT